MPTKQFTELNLPKMAKWYAKYHADTDLGIQEIWYLPKNANEREIRLLEVNDAIVEQKTLEPIDFGMDRGMDTEHQLNILDVTPGQWKKIQGKKLVLPDDWQLDDGKLLFARKASA